MKIPLEDNFEDVLSKAARGLGLGPKELGRLANLDPNRIRKVLDGHFDSGIVARLAAFLDLDGPALFELATKAWAPDPVELEGLAAFNTLCPVAGYGEMAVNSYLVWDPATRYAAAFDTGGSVEDMLDLVREKALRLNMICLTHTHPDHIHVLKYLLEATHRPQLYVHEKEALPGAQTFQSGDGLSIGHLQVETRLTSGHSPGGTTYVVSGLSQPVAIVGDALFSCSMGGAAEHFREAKQLIRENILGLPINTILCPGHGPVTTVGQELQHNPFFALGS